MQDGTFPTYSIPHEDLFITYSIDYEGTLDEGTNLHQYVTGVWMQTLPREDLKYYNAVNCTDLFEVENVGK